VDRGQNFSASPRKQTAFLRFLFARIALSIEPNTAADFGAKMVHGAIRDLLNFAIPYEEFISLS
jgi:hypothetical protein